MASYSATRFWNQIQSDLNTTLIQPKLKHKAFQRVVLNGQDIVRSILASCHSSSNEQYKAATAENAVKLGQKLVHDGFFIALKAKHGKQLKNSHSVKYVLGGGAADFLAEQSNEATTSAYSAAKPLAEANRPAKGKAKRKRAANSSSSSLDDETVSKKPDRHGSVKQTPTNYRSTTFTPMDPELDVIPAADVLRRRISSAKRGREMRFSITPQAAKSPIMSAYCREYLPKVEEAVSSAASQPAAVADPPAATSTGSSWFSTDFNFLRNISKGFSFALPSNIFGSSRAAARKAPVPDPAAVRVSPPSPTPTSVAAKVVVIATTNPTPAIMDTTAAPFSFGKPLEVHVPPVRMPVLPPLYTATMAARVLPTFDPPLTSATPATDINPMNTTTTVTFQAQPPAYQAPAQRRQKRRHRQQRQHARRSRALPGVMENHMATMAVEEENVEQEPQAKRSHRLPEPVKSVSSLGLWSKDIHHYFAKRRAVLQVLRLAELQFDDLLAELRLMPDAAAVRVTRNADKYGFLGEPLAQDSLPAWLTLVVEQLSEVVDCNSKWQPLQLRAQRQCEPLTLSSEADARVLLRRYFERLPSAAIPTEAALVLRKVALLLNQHAGQQQQQRLMTLAMTALPQTAKALLSLFIRNAAACADVHPKTCVAITDQARWLVSTLCQLQPTRRNKVMHELIATALAQVVLNPAALTWCLEEGIDADMREAMQLHHWQSSWPLTSPDASITPSQHLFLRKLCGHQGLNDSIC